MKVTITGIIKGYKDEFNNTINSSTANVKINLQGTNNEINIGLIEGSADVELFCEGSNNKISIDNKTIISGVKVKIFIRQNNNILRIEQGCKSVSYGYRNTSPVEIVMMGSSKLIIEKNTSFAPSSNIYMHPYSLVHIKQDCMFSFDTVIQAGDGHSIFDINSKNNINSNLLNLENENWLNQVVIGAHTWVGRNVIILGGKTELAQGSIIGAQSFVKGIYPNNVIIVGKPAEVKKYDVSWSKSNMERNIENCRSPFAIPTVKFGKIEKEKRMMQKINNFYDYFDALKNLKNYICLIAVKDTPGHKLKELEQTYLTNMGLKKELTNKHWCGYVAVFNEYEVTYEFLSAEGEGVEEQLIISGISILISSYPLKAGNNAEIVINGNNYSVNERGLNIALWDKDTHQIFDMVCFDTHVKNIPCIRKTNLC